MRPIQMKMARAALGLSIREVSEAVEVSEFTIKRVEKGSDAMQSTIDGLRGLYEGRGIRFAKDGESLGVWVDPPAQGELLDAAQ